MEITFFLPNGEDLMVQLPRESLKMPMINPNLGQSIQQSVVYDPTTGTSRIQTSIVSTPGMKRSLYDEIRMRPGFGTPFVDSYGYEGFFETGLPSKLGSTIGNSSIAPPGMAGSQLVNSGIVDPNLAQSGINTYN